MVFEIDRFWVPAARIGEVHDIAVGLIMVGDKQSVPPTAILLPNVTSVVRIFKNVPLFVKLAMG